MNEWIWKPWYEVRKFVCIAKDCHAILTTVEAERRLNATERLSPHLMGSLAYDRKLERYWRQAFAEYAQAMYGDDYQMPDEFAAALEESPTT